MPAPQGKKEDIMAVSRDINFGSYCDTVDSELTQMKSRLLGIIKSIETMSGPETQRLASHGQHLRDIVNTIDWKLEILMRVCPADWKGFGGKVESSASVQLEESPEALESIAGGYVGG
jgi:hypothetical protein